MIAALSASRDRGAARRDVRKMLTRWRTRAHAMHGIHVRARATLAIACRLLAACLLVAASANARAQDLEPRAFSNTPLGLNFLLGGYGYTTGGVAVDPSV